MQECGDKGPTRVALDQPWIPWEEPALCWRPRQLFSSSRSWLHFQIIRPKKKKTKKKNKLQPHKITKLNIPVPWHPEPSFTHNQNFQKSNENNNPYETWLSQGFTATVASEGDNALPALCPFNTQRPRVDILLPSEFLPKPFALLGMAFQIHLSDTTSLFTFSSKTSYVFLCDSQIPLLHSRALNWCFCYEDHKFWVNYVSFISLSLCFSQGIL